MAEAFEWAGQMGREWARRVEALDRQLAPAGALGLAALAPRPGERILDLGCGDGATTAKIVAAVGSLGAVTGIDISPDLLAVARARPGNEAAMFLEGDAQGWDFEAGAYDALFSRFGGMFFADPPAAYANLRRALKPGARVVLTVWRDLAANPWAALPAAVGAEVLGPADDPFVPGAPGPFAWADPTIFRPILEGAGFTGLEWREEPISLQVGETGEAGPVARAVAMLMRIGPAARRLKGRPEADRAAVAARLAPALEPFVSDGWVRMPGLIWVIRARA
ncbi:MAG: methyltransferase domain-containing protein [Proteobacteria bacterium]|nr:methyltransferase domain-containing protein [Pseudomonadota bacterium]